MNMLLISVGAVLGALLRWQFGLWFNALFSQLAFGTLLANWLGCLLIGMAMELSLHDSHKLLFITGFLGSFTTFSSFSAELGEKILAQKYGQVLSVLSLHLVGGVALTLCGIWLARLFTSGRIG